MPFGNGWTDRPDEDWQTGFARYFWRQRGAWDADSWALPFAVLLDGVPVGVQQLTAEDFPVLRDGRHRILAVGSPSTGRGIGTEMRAAVLHFGFEVLGAELASPGRSRRARARSASRRRSATCETERGATARAGRAVAHLFRLPRERWEIEANVPVEVEGFDGCERLFGLDPGPAGHEQASRGELPLG